MLNRGRYKKKGRSEERPTLNLKFHFKMKNKITQIY